MAAADHLRLADELVDSARAGGVRSKTLVPAAQRVALDVTEPLVAKGDNKLIHIRMIEIAADQRILLLRIAPPTHHFGRLQPAPDQCKIGGPTPAAVAIR